MPGSLQIMEINGKLVCINPNARPITEEGNEQPETARDLEPLLAHADRGGIPRRLQVWQEIVDVLVDVEVGDYGLSAKLGRFSIALPDEIEQKLRPLKGQKIAILRFSDRGYSVRVA